MPKGPPTIVVVGRTNFREYSAALNDLVGDLHRSGYAMCRLESRYTATSRWLDDRASRLLRRDAAAGTPLTRAVKATVLLTRPSRWDYLRTFLEGPNRSSARDLRRLIRSLPTDQVCLVSHSAGGIAATMVADEPAVTKIVCFGYPFKHPDREDESFRTAHLPSVTTPFLIVQGDQDVYGTADDAAGYRLSPSTAVERVAAEHGFGTVDPAEYARCLALVLDFLAG